MAKKVVKKAGRPAVPNKRGHVIIYKLNELELSALEAERQASPHPGAMSHNALARELMLQKLRDNGRLK